jgi:23S rRNA U2552 (ribose-2'-O)-methylase RlmE/FtsJ
MMQDIGRELDQKTGAFSAFGTSLSPPKFLDVCMAPGGFSKLLMDMYPDSQVYGISLPPSIGGHKILLDIDDPRVSIQFLDVTLLAVELKTSESLIPKDHPDFQNFRYDRPFLSDKFDLAICDGQVLRTHQRQDYRERVEGKRLLVSQLVFAFSRIKPGGTVVILQHKPEVWDNVKLLNTLNKFSVVQLFKPAKHHTFRSSYYLVASAVQTQSPHALAAVEYWKTIWMETTFEREHGCPSDEEVKSLLSTFGEQFVKMAEPIWMTQKNALEKKSFCK